MAERPPDERSERPPRHDEADDAGSVPPDVADEVADDEPSVPPPER